MTDPTPEEPETALVLVGGANFPTWPDLKWARAMSHFATFENRFNEWIASAPVIIDAVFRDDRQGFDLVARIPRGIPTQEWSLTLGDAIHNLRSAFDAVAWGMANFYESKPTKPRSVTFPICTKRSDWNDVRWVRDIRPEFHERIEKLQPYNYVPEGQETALTLLHALDIQDKHRDFITVSADLDGVGIDLSYRYEDGVPENVLPRIEMMEGVAFRDGAHLATIHAGATIKDLGTMQFRPMIKVRVEHEGVIRDLSYVLDTLKIECRRLLDMLAAGITIDNEGDQATA